MRLLQKYKKLLEEKGYWEVLSYLFFGGATTLVNFVVFFLFFDIFHTSLVISNAMAWLLSVLFAFVTNKLWVFQSHSSSSRQVLWEFFKFIFYRVLSLGIDMGSLMLFVDVIHWPVYVGKLLSQILVVVANYVFSKLFIFRKE